MRINLTCPYSEKDQAKALGARWDNDKRTWYVIDPKDLMQFARWLNLKKVEKAVGNSVKQKKRGSEIRVTGNLVTSCSCDVLPWEDCEHTVSDELDENQREHLKSI
jgi:hypothetical protein